MSVTGHNDLASGGLLDSMVPQQLFLGEIAPYTNNAVAAAAITKYQICALLPAGTVTPFIPGTHTAAQAVVAAQPTASGDNCPYFGEGIFNYAVVTISAGDNSLNTLLKMKGFFNGGSGIKIDALQAGA